MTTPVFILGCGRGGTHYLANILRSNVRFTVTIEENPIFDLAKSVSIYNNHKNIQPLFGQYADKIKSCNTDFYADKSHVNLWIADKIADTFLGCRLIAIDRNPYSVVSSMLRHPEVLNWTRIYNTLPMPNRFLGINDDTILREYKSMSDEERCALRWLSHHNEIKRLSTRLHASIFHAIDYDAFVEDFTTGSRNLSHFLGCDDSFTDITSQEPRKKYRSHLTDAQIAAIDSIIGRYGGIV